MSRQSYRPRSTSSRAAALGAMAALSACGPLRALHQLSMSCLDAPGPKNAPGTIIQGTIPPVGRQGAVRYALALPSNVEPRAVKRVVYVLPGRGGTAP